MRKLAHPAPEDIQLSAIFDALADPTRLEAVLYLAKVGEANCSAFDVWGSKTNLHYHLKRLREAGITHARPDGTSIFLTLRRADLEARFPGLLDQILRTARKEIRGEGAAEALSARNVQSRPPRAKKRVRAAS